MAPACATGEDPDPFVTYGPGLANATDTGTTTGDIGSSTEETDDSDDGADSTGDVVFEEGRLWCLRADSAEYIDGSGTPISIQPYLPLDPDGPEGCWCMPQEIHDILDLAKDPGTGLVVIDANDGWDQDIVDLRTLAEIVGRGVCQDEVPKSAQSDNCSAPDLYDSDAVAAGIQPPPMYYGNVSNETLCVVSRLIESDIDLQCAQIPPGYGVSYNASEDTYSIPSNTLQYFLANPECLTEEDARITFSANGDYQFSQVRAGQLLATLGLREGDVPLRLNSHNLNSPSDAMLAYLNALGSSSWTLDIRRNSAQVSLHYDLK